MKLIFSNVTIKQHIEKPGLKNAIRFTNLNTFFDTVIIVKVLFSHRNCPNVHWKETILHIILHIVVKVRLARLKATVPLHHVLQYRMTPLHCLLQYPSTTLTLVLLQD